MKQALQRVRKAAFKAGKAETKKSLLPYVRKWMKRNKIATINFINGRVFVYLEGDNTTAIWPDDLTNLKVANELISLSNAVGYENGFDLPQIINQK